MTDVETRTPQKTPKKRKSVEGKPESPKKLKIENGKTPQKLQTPKQQKNQQTPNLQKNQQTPKQQKNQLNNAEKSNKKVNQANQPGTKKVKPFAGTAEVQSPKQKKNPKGDKKVPVETAEKKPKIERKPRRKLMTMLKDKLKSGDSESKAEVIKNLETKLQAIQSRTDLTKTALRKIKLLKRLKNIAEGKAPAPAQNKSGMTESAKRRDRRKMAVLKSAEGQGQKEVAVKNAKKGPQAKVKNEKKKKQEVKVEKIEEQSEDEESDDDDGEEEEEEEDSGEEAVEGEDSGDEGDSGEEEEGSDDDEEGSDDDEESSEDEEVVSPPKPPVKVSNKKQKGKK